MITRTREIEYFRNNVLPKYQSKPLNMNQNAYRLYLVDTKKQLLQGLRLVNTELDAIRKDF